MKKYLVPGAAVAVIIAVIGVFIAIGADKPGPGSAGSAKKASGGATPCSGDTSDTGMSDSMPATVGPEWTMLPGGLKYWDVKVGEGETVSAGQTVAMHYTGWLASDGSKFDSSRGKSHLDMSLTQLIPGWQNGIPGMKVGGIRRLYIPWAQGYGAQGSGSSIPPKSDLVFEVKLLGYQ
ncbi:hypothetical protein BH11PLA2_BH11PLA2_18330 [soil metagenome]